MDHPYFVDDEDMHQLREVEHHNFLLNYFLHFRKKMNE
jgi:hypothetical protein